jgi:hypothetical protein
MQSPNGWKDVEMRHPCLPCRYTLGERSLRAALPKPVSASVAAVDDPRGTLMKKIEAIGIVATLLLAPGYAALMKSSGEPIEWGVVAFIVGMAVFLTLYATVLRKYTENTKENRDAMLKIVKKVAKRALSQSDD